VDPNAPPPTLDLRVIARMTLMIRAVDEQGVPVSGARIWAFDAGSSSPEQDSSTFEILKFDPMRSGRVTILHESRKLIGSVELARDEAGPVTVRLSPWGAITGRIVDEDGRPGGSLSLLCFPDAFNPQQPDNAILTQAIDGNFIRKGHTMPRIKAGGDGQFRIEGIVPGLKYQALVSGEGEIPSLDIVQNFAVRAGEVKDLGDLVVPSRRTPGIATPKAIIR
jgi:hypothetical protein